MRKPQRCVSCVLGITMLSAVIAPHAVEAKTIRCDAGRVDCLIAAINEANSNGQPSNMIRLEPGVYLLTSVDNQTDGANGLPSITSPLTIAGGDGSTTFIARPNASPDFRLVHVGPSGRLTLKGLTLSGGGADPPGALYNAGGVLTTSNIVVSANRAGGLSNAGGTVSIVESVFVNNVVGTRPTLSSTGQLAITNSTFVNNQNEMGVIVIGDSADIIDCDVSNNTVFMGPVVRVSGDGTVSITRTTFRRNVVAEQTLNTRGNSSPTVVIKDSAFLDNSGSPGIAISNGIGIVNVTNTTFARNTAGSFFGQLGPSDGIAVVNHSGSMSITNSTFADNHTALGTRPSGAVIHSEPNATMTLQNSIVSHDPLLTSILDCDGSTSLGNNLISDGSCAVMPSDLTGDPGLGAFVDNLTPGNGHFRLLPTSRAIDSGNDAACPAKDQIGQSRLHQCDIGAIEFHNDHER